MNDGRRVHSIKGDERGEHGEMACQSLAAFDASREIAVSEGKLHHAVAVKHLLKGRGSGI
jgi:hypothetical protein